MSHINIEIKARSRNQEKIRNLLKSKNATFKGVDHQIDTYFNVPNGRMKLREGNIENTLIYYNRPNQAGPKQSDINLYFPETDSPLKPLLINALGTKVIIDKQREIYFIENVKFHVDTVKDLGTYVEIEAIGEQGKTDSEELLKQCQFYMKLFEIEPSDLIDVSYSDLLLEKEMTMKKDLTADYWNDRYLEKKTGWDIGEASKPLVKYFETLTDRSLKILIPGAGRAHEAIWLFENGFKNVFVCDWAETAFDILKQTSPNFPCTQLLVSDFFKLENQFDLIVEQTFFCAINPTLRPAYAKKAAELLKSTGKIAGVLFGVDFPKQGPPFGGSKEEYIRIFAPHFEILEIETTAKSIKPRLGSELFFEFKKKG